MITLGLQRITHLLQPLFTSHPTGLPWKAIHIAGTNGKGSTASLLAAFLARSGYVVGRFTSPHLVDRWDCITLDQRVVDRERFLAVEARVKRRAAEAASTSTSASASADHDADGVVGVGVGTASEFEILTATAFELFTDAGIDVAVVECGLGGRLDATNVLRREDVLVSVLTKVGLDHVDFLGPTVAHVAREKVGIFKEGVPVVVDHTNESVVMDVVREKLKVLGEPDDGMWELPREEIAGVCDSESLRAMGLDLARHQRENLVTAYTAYVVAERRLAAARNDNNNDSKRTADNDNSKRTAARNNNDTKSTENWRLRVAETARDLPELIRTAHASLPGRLQWLDLPLRLLPPGTTRTRTVLIDGAHNEQSAQALAEYVDVRLRQNHDQESVPSESRNTHLHGSQEPVPITWVLAMKSDKDIHSVLSTLLRPSDRVITCAFGAVDGMPWVKSMSATKLAETIVATVKDVQVEAAEAGSVGAALTRAVQVADNRPICVAGSLYLVGDVLRLVRDCEDDGGTTQRISRTT